MARMAGLVLAGTALGACAPMQGTQSTWPVRRPAPVAGTRWSYQVRTGASAAGARRFEDRIVSLTDSECEIEHTLLPPDAGGSGNTVRRRIGAEVWWQGTGLLVERPAGMRSHLLQFPLGAGQQWISSFRGDQTVARTHLMVTAPVYQWAATVEDFEVLDVPAGRFDVVRVVHEGLSRQTHHHGGSITHMFETLWYAPKVQHLVKIERGRHGLDLESGGAGDAETRSASGQLRGWLMGGLIEGAFTYLGVNPSSPLPLHGLRKLFPKEKPPVTETTELVAWSRP